MALLQCSECAGKVSDKAPFCPQCGAPLQEPLAADKPTTFKPAAQEEVRKPEDEYVSIQVPIDLSGLPSSPVPPPGLHLISDSAVTSPVGSTNSISSHIPSPDTSLEVPAANPPSQSLSFGGRNMAAVLVLLFVFAGTSYLPDSLEVAGRSISWPARWPLRVVGIFLTYGIFGFADSKNGENPVGVFLCFAAFIVALFLKT